MSILRRLFGRQSAPVPTFQASEENRISASSVEKNIDEAGRDAVFRRAKELGWDGMLPPLWVWNAIAIDIILQKQSTAAAHESKTATIN